MKTIFSNNEKETEIEFLTLRGWKPCEKEGFKDMYIDPESSQSDPKFWKKAVSIQKERDVTRGV